MANKRIFELAKELGVKSKAIVDKCHAEGIPKDVIKNHMSTISIGLEQTVREWFADVAGDEESPHTAVEESDRVDFERAKQTKPRARKAKPAETRGDSSEDGGGGDGSVATVEKDPPPPSVRAGVRAGVRAAPAPGEGPDRGGSETTEQETAEQETADHETGAPAASRPEAPSAEESGSTTPESAGESDATPGTDTGADKGTDQDTDGAEDQGSKAPPRTVARPNVPRRPKSVTPAGPRLEDQKRESVKLSGPKVVRVEAPERVEPPRQRPQGGGRGRGPGGGPGGGPGVADPSGPPPEGRPPRGGNSRRRQQTGRNEEVPRGSGWTEADLAEREARLKRSGGYLKERQKQMRSSSSAAPTPATVGGRVEIAEPFTIKDLSAATGVKGAEIVKKLFMQGVMATINSGIEPEKAQEILMDWNIELEVTAAKSAEQQVEEQFVERDRAEERDRGPIVTILGHVDHGKTSLLDKIRNANVAEGEAGGITQATSAFRVPVTSVDQENFVTFIDTPGHEAFTAMRSRGANVTDIVVLVVAADDGVMPQTKESISHAKAAGVPIIVALNKMDKPEATDSNIQKIMGQLAEQELNPTDWGGDTEIVRTSAIKNEGVQDLLEILDLQSQVLELKADYTGPAQGTVIEARPEEGRGNVANILVQEGELSLGDFIVMGRAYGRVRDITDDRGKRIKSALPPVPVQISGINELPDAGDKFYCVGSLKEAERAAHQRRDRERQEHLAQPKLTLDSMFSQMAEKELKEIRVVLKADVQGSVDVLTSEIEKVTGDEVRVRVIHAAVGGITESDILLANASEAIIIGFNVIANAKGRALADAKGVEIRNYQVIYHIVEDMKKAAEGLLSPDIRQEVLGHAEVRQVFKITKVGAVAGCYVTDGVVERDALVRVTRDGVVVENDRRLEQLKRFKDDTKEVRSNMECGMKVAGYDDIKEGDVIECYKNVEVARTL